MKTDFILNWMAMLARAQVRIIGIKRDLFWIPFDVVLPLLGVSTFIFIYKSLNVPEFAYGFVVLGGAMIAYWLNILWSMASQLYWERMTGNLPIFFIAPCSINSILVGMALGGMVATSVRAISILILGILIFKIPINFNNIGISLLVFLITLLALYGLGMMLSSVFLLSGREAWHLASLLQEPIYLFSGFFFPIKVFPFIIAFLSSLLPTTLGLDALRQTLILESKPFAFLTLELEISMLVLLSIVYIVASFYLVKRVETIAKKEGKLIIRWH